MRRLILVEAPDHEKHHVRGRGYQESPRRQMALSRGVRQLEVEVRPVKSFPEKFLYRVHDKKLLDFLRSSSEQSIAGKYEYPFMLPVHRPQHPPKDWTLAVGYYCIDTFTPIHRESWNTARKAVDCALTAAAEILGEHCYSYALVRPPGHHSERSYFGGYCYLNSAAIAANYLSQHGRVAMLDIDYHHGNGQQDIFWERDDVLTVSIHGHPDFAYPYFSGFKNEIGAGKGKGFNINMPLPESVNGAEFIAALKKASKHIKQFNPKFLVVPIGFDTARNDPSGSWSLDPADFKESGKLLASLGPPTVFVQEGGYQIGRLAKYAKAFFAGVLA